MRRKRQCILLCGIIAALILTMAGCKNPFLAKLKEKEKNAGPKTENMFTVTFDTNEGSFVAPITVVSGSTITLPTPTKEGYTFVDWFTDDGSKFTSSTPVTADITVYARWTGNPVYVTFDSNDGSDVVKVTGVFGETITLPEKPTKDGYLFDGWFTDDNTFVNEFTSSTLVTADIIVYAKWKINIFEGNVIALPVVFRDFVGKGLRVSGKPSGIEHSDFENFSGSGTSRLVQKNLDVDGKPQWRSNTGSDTTTKQLTSEEFFRLWYRDVPLTSASTTPGNVRLDSTISFTKNADGSYSYLDDSFFPFSDKESCVSLGYERNNNGKNFGFTTELEFDFIFNGGELLDFTGDDDVWVFIDGQIVLDLGGLSSSTNGKVRLSLDSDGSRGIVETKGYTFNNGGAEGATPTGVIAITAWRSFGTSLGLIKGNRYTLKLFHAERHSTGSNFNLILDGFSIIKP